MSIDAGMAQLADRMAQLQQGADAEGSGLHVEASAGLDVRLGRLVSLLEQERHRRALMSQLLNVVDLPPLDFAVAAGVAKLKSYRASAADISPQEGYMWFVQRLSLAGLNAGDAVNLYRTVSNPTAASMNAVHTFEAPGGPGVGVNAEGSVTNPGAGGFIIATGTLPVGVYQITVTVYLSGTVTAADGNNMNLTVGGGTIETLAYPGVANAPVTFTTTAAISPAAGVGVRAIAAASGASAIYNADVAITPLSSVGSGLGVADWTPGSNGLVLRPDDQLWLASAGSLTATELVLTGQAIQVHLSVLADYLM